VSDPPYHLVAWARLDGPAALLVELRRRLENDRLGPRARVELDWSPAERHQIGQLLDVTWAGSGQPVRVRDLRAGLAQHGTTLEALLVHTGGALRDLGAQRAQRRAARQADQASAVGVLMGQLGVADDDPRAPSLAQSLSRWVLARPTPGAAGPPAGSTPPASAVQLADSLAQVVADLPVGGPAERLAVLAARCLGDAHGLDRSRVLGRALARFLALRAVVAAGGTVLSNDPIATQEGWRDAWASAGIACDSVSARVLVLNLPLVGAAPAVALCAATPGEPVWLSLRALAGGVSLARPEDVFVCENPAIVEAAADRWGARCAPLICLFGRPDAAGLALLTHLSPVARLHIRADGDPTGWSIVTALLSSLPGAVPWRMPTGLTAYEEELAADLLSDLAPT
jgi:uncharacterized protein (TIGR02679 family)